MEIMAEKPDNYWDLAIVDPPYGINMDRQIGGCRKNTFKKQITKSWDKFPPTKEYFKELFRVSKNQIIWGGNYFADLLPAKSCWIVWDKVNGGSDQADCELAWTSFNSAVRQIEYMWCIAQGVSSKNGRTAQGNNKLWEKKLHPTQKPAIVYKWLLKNYAKPEFKLLDTHGGSMSSVIAGYDFGIAEMVCTEIDKEYFDAGVKRVMNHVAQLNMYVKRPEIIIN